MTQPSFFVFNLCYQNLGFISLIASNYALFGNVTILVTFRSLFIITVIEILIYYGFIGKIYIVQINQNIPYFNFKNYFFIYKNQFLLKNDKFFVVFAYIFLNTNTKFSDFVNSDDCIREITSKYIRLQPVFIKKKFEVNK